MCCKFCHEIANEQILFTTKNYQVVLDIDPIQQGHLLIISKKHIDNLCRLSAEESLELITLEQKLVHVLETNFPVLGVTIAQNNGRLMDPGTHFHVHVIPRYSEDGFWDTVHVEEKEFAVAQLKELLQTQ